MDYQAWNIVDDFTVAQASCLWCGVEPSVSFLMQKADNGQIAAIEQMLVSEIRAGRLPADLTHALVIIGDYSLAVVTRDALERVAEAKGQRPAFMFPDERPDIEGVKTPPPTEAKAPQGTQGSAGHRVEPEQTTSKERWWPKKSGTRQQWRQWWVRYERLKATTPNLGARRYAEKIAKEDLEVKRVTPEVESRTETIRKALRQMEEAGEPPPAE